MRSSMLMSFLIGFIIYDFSQSYGLALWESLALCFGAGALQGIIMSLISSSGGPK